MVTTLGLAQNVVVNSVAGANKLLEAYKRRLPDIENIIVREIQINEKEG